MSSNNQTSKVTKLEELRLKIRNNAAAYHIATAKETAIPPGMHEWMDAYNDIKEEDSVSWKLYCTGNGLSTEHDATDLIA
jgi:hypothetical protein